MSTAILHIDTSTQTALVMLAVNGKPVAHKSSETERDHAAKINLLIADVLKEGSLSIADLSAITVCNGPGSYTGLRIGLATAKGFCYALDKPLILHNRLSLMLQELDAQLNGRDLNRLAILPARTGEYYVAAAGEYAVEPTHIMASELSQNIACAIKSFGIIGQYNVVFPIQIEYNIDHQSLDLDVWATATYQAFLQKDFADLAYSTPDYLKSAYITTPRADR